MVNPATPLRPGEREGRPPAGWGDPGTATGPAQGQPGGATQGQPGGPGGATQGEPGGPGGATQGGSGGPGGAAQGQPGGATQGQPGGPTRGGPGGAPRGRRPQLWRLVAVAGVLAGMVSLAGAALGRVYHGELLTALVAGSALGSVGLSLLARRLPNWVVAPLSMLALAGYTAWVLRMTAQRADLPGSLTDIARDALSNGIPRLLTSMIPVEPQPDTVLVAVMAGWLAGLAGAEMALRAGRVLLGYLPPTLLYLGALYVVGPNADAAAWPTIGYAALAALGLAVTGRSAGTAGALRAALPGLARSARLGLALRQTLSAAVGVAVVVALAALIGPAVADRVGHTPVDPRRYVPPPQVDSLDENPLIRISGWAINPDQHLLDATLAAVPGSGDDNGSGSNDGSATGDASGGRDGDNSGDGSGDSGSPDDGDSSGGSGSASGTARIRLAVLNDYDGITWRVGANYRTAGRVLPPVQTPAGGDLPVADGPQLQQQITIADLTGKLLPAVASPRQVDGVRLAYDQASGTLIRPEGLTSGLRYTVTSVPDRPDVNLLTTADVPAGPAVARQLALGEGVPAQMEELAQRLGEQSAVPYERALALEEFLSQHYRLVADAPSGHAYPNLSFFLFGASNAGGQRGTSEQFAASFAVLGRLLGLPTRVVVGFQTRAGTTQIRGADAFAWPEVLFSGVGWVAFDPLPRPNATPRPVEEDFRPEPDKSTPPPSEAPVPSLSPTTAAPASESAPAAAGGGADPLLPLVAAGGGAVLLGTAYAVAVPVLRGRMRRRRLYSGAPADRVAGAWLEVTDALRLAGRPAPVYLSATEVADHAAGAAGASGSTPADADLRPGPGPGQPQPGPDRWGTVAPGAPAGPPVGRLRPAVPPLDELARLVNQARFAPTAADDGQARLAGTQAVAFVAQLRAHRSRWRRLVWSLHPGPLRWSRRRGQVPPDEQQR